MRLRHSWTPFAWLSLLGLSGAAVAVQPKGESGPLDRLAATDPRLHPAPVIQPIEDAGAGLTPALLGVWSGFLQEQGGDWQGFVDLRNGFLEIAEGPGIPWIPGTGNQLTREDVAAHLAGAEVDLAALESIARAFLPGVAPLLGVEPRSLQLNRGRSGEAGESLWLVDFDVLREGTPIEGARVVFRVNNGNLVQLGGENLPSAGVATPREQVSRVKALALLAQLVEGFSAADTFLDGGSRHLLPVSLAAAGTSQGFVPGAGRGLALVWQFVFRRGKEAGTWRARIDATTGELLELRDVQLYGKVNGGVYPGGPEPPAAGGEVVLPMPFADLSSGGFTDASGEAAFSGSPVLSTLSGRYVDIDDDCGSTWQSANAAGRISFGTSAGTDCTTPGSGGAGNTHAARTQFYHLNRVKEIARGWLPASPWLSGQLPVHVNLPDTCNAYWDGQAVSFFRSGGGCANTGEIAAVAVHEYGHGLDENDGNDLSPDLGTAETYGDFTAALTLHTSCVGAGFASSQCGGYGDACTACTGVRDLDWARHASNTPHRVGNFTQLRCPPGGSYAGPCGREGHCESYVSSEALWDLAARDLPSPGSPAAWRVMERLWYLSRSTATAAFTCDPSPPTWTSHGCDTGSLWRVLRFVDDDDGNLANGTPHSCQLFAAFDRHGLACAADAGANVCFSGCTPPAAPVVVPTPGADRIDLSWASAGPGIVYDVYKSERGCNSGFQKVADNLTGLAFADTVVTEGLSYSYQVVAHPGGNEACGSAPSTCLPATPAPPLCGLSAPAGLTATADGLSTIRLAWNAVPGATAYLVYRAPASGGPYTEAGSVAAPATTWPDTGLPEGTRWFYVVRAFAGCDSAPSAEATAATQACIPTTLYQNDFETGGGLSDWTRGVFPGGTSPSEWQGIQTCAAHGGSKVFRFGGGADCSASAAHQQQTFAQPRGATGIAVPSGVLATRLSFWHRWDFEPGWDGGTLALSLDGSSYTFIPAAAIVSGASYTGATYLSCVGPAGRPVFTGAQGPFVQTVAGLDAACNLASGGTGGCGGRTIRVAFVAQTDCSVPSPGWSLDDVAVQVCGAAPALPPPSDFYTLTPCRLVDTRGTDGPLGGPALPPGAVRTFVLAGTCGVPPAARALSLNLTVSQPAAGGFVTLAPTGVSMPTASAISFSAGQSRANNALIALGAGTGAIVAKNVSGGTVHVVIDVTGYFE